LWVWFLIQIAQNHLKTCIKAIKGKNNYMKLLQPFKLGSVELKNRIIMPAIHNGFCENGYITEKAINYYRERALGGVGLIITGTCTIDPYPGYWSMKAKARIGEQDKRRGNFNEIELGDDKFIPGHSLLVKAVHEAGAKIGVQIIHFGRNEWSEWLPIAPSAIPSFLTGITPREMNLDDIQEVKGFFASASRRAKEAGYDLVEVSGGYLITQFFSPLGNMRKDEYGGSFENRMRFGLEVIEAVRREVGADFPIMMRFPGSEFMPGGNTSIDAQRFACRLEESGVNAFDVTGGAHETNMPQITMNVPPGAFTYLAQGIKQATNVPVVACNRINDPLLAEEILLNDSADLIGMARPLVADPELPNKVAQGRYSEIRKCVGCNQGCLDNIFAGKKITCTVNARVGREKETEIKPAEKCRKVLVIGAGVSGMEAARVAAARGHNVTLWEMTDELGGQILKAGAAPGRSDLLNIVNYYRATLSASQVNIAFNKEASSDAIRALAPDFVIFSTGAKPIIPPISGINSRHVLEAGKVLREQVELGHRVVIIGAGAVGCEVGMRIALMGTIDSRTIRFLLLHEAETVERIKYLATHGTKEVVIIEMDKSAGRGLGNSTRWFMLNEMKQLGIKIMTSTIAKSVVPDGILVTQSDGQEKLIPCDNVVIAVGSRPDNALYNEIKDEFPSALLGDAGRVRTALDAIREGFDAGYKI